jgi:uncharacterized protein YuzE
MPSRDVALTISLDDESNMAYLRLADGRRHSVKQVAVETDEAGGEVVLDLDADGRLIGVEIFDARSLLPDKILKALSE